MSKPPSSGRRQRPVSAGRPDSRRSSRQLKTTFELNGDENDPEDVLLSMYTNRKYTPLELREAHAFFHRLANHNQGGATGSYVTKRQFHMRMHKVVPHADQECRELLRHFLDKNHDGIIDEAEFVAGWGFMKEELKLLENDQNRYALEELQHNFPEDVVEQLVMVFDGYVNDRKLGCFEESKFQSQLVHLFGYDHRQAETLCHMLADAPTLPDGSISFKAFVKAHSFFHNGATAPTPHTDKVHIARSITAAQMREARAIFKNFDINKDGAIDSGEMHARMADFGWNDNEIMSIVADMDTDHDGKVSLEEFAAAYLDFL